MAPKGAMTYRSAISVRKGARFAARMTSVGVGSSSGTPASVSFAPAAAGRGDGGGGGGRLGRRGAEQPRGRVETEGTQARAACRRAPRAHADAQHARQGRRSRRGPRPCPWHRGPPARGPCRPQAGEGVRGGGPHGGGRDGRRCCRRSAGSPWAGPILRRVPRKGSSVSDRHRSVSSGVPQLHKRKRVRVGDARRRHGRARVQPHAALLHDEVEEVLDLRGGRGRG